MKELSFNIKLDERSSSEALDRIKYLVEKYPKIADEVTNNILSYINLKTVQLTMDSAIIVTEVNESLHDLIGKLYGVRFINITADDSIGIEYMEVQE